MKMLLKLMPYGNKIYYESGMEGADEKTPNIHFRRKKMA